MLIAAKAGRECLCIVVLRAAQWNQGDTRPDPQSGEEYWGIRKGSGKQQGGGDLAQAELNCIT